MSWKPFSKTFTQRIFTMIFLTESFENFVVMHVKNEQPNNVSQLKTLEDKLKLTTAKKKNIYMFV